MKTITLFFTFFFLLISCEKDNPVENQNPPNAVYTLIAGDVFNDSIIYHEFNPYITVKGKRIGVDTNFTYHDSLWIDLNNDSIDDIYFEYYRSHFQPSCDCEGIDCCMPSDELYCNVRSKSNIEIATEKVYSFDLPIRFSIGDSIDDRYNWMNFETTHDFGLPGLESAWNEDCFNSFLGIRLKTKKDTLYCWMRINTHHLNSIEIYDFAIEK